jgi:predicted glycoside hydrolase/deacetylase ChbG (UPF0249 family)
MTTGERDGFRGAGRRLIVSADDYGLGAAVDHGIVRAARAGSVTSVGVMGNLATPAAVRALAAAAPRVSIGVHLNLTTGRPLSSPAEVPSLVDGTGAFRPLGMLAARALRRRVRRADVVRELGAQIAAVRAAGVPVDHLDSHEHVHLIPGVLGAVVEVAKRTGILALRSHRPCLLSAGPWSGTIRGTVRWYAERPRRLAAHTVKRLLVARLRAAGLALPDGMVGGALVVGGAGEGPDAEWDAVCAHLPAGTWELVVHPADLAVASSPEETARLGALTARRGAELHALLSPAFAARLRRHGIALVPFAPGGTAGAPRIEIQTRWGVPAQRAGSGGDRP